jgi:2-methylcitrate dehydratase PrpD
LWEPLSVKHRPPTTYAAKFSTPFCMAVGFFDRKAGLAQFSDDRVRDAEVLALCGKIRYVINPNDDYPRNFSGHLRATLRDGRVEERRQPYMRGGAHAPLAALEVEAKFVDNARYGGWSEDLAQRLLRVTTDLFSLPDLHVLREFRA